MQFPRPTFAILMLFALIAHAQAKPSGVSEKGKSATATGQSKSNEMSPGGTGTFTDARDGQVYKYVTIGKQTWMAKNLNFAAEGSWCYDNDTSMCTTYGRLYDWKTVLNGGRSSVSIPSGVKGICPSGWHVPSDGEWEALMTTLEGADFAGDKLKSTNGLNDQGHATDEFGFGALTGGLFYDGSFKSSGEYGFWWSATGLGMTQIVWIRIMHKYESDVQRGGYGQMYGLSLRCIKDVP